MAEDEGKRVVVDWQDSTRTGTVIGPWPDPGLKAKYLAVGIQPDEMDGMVAIRYDDIGVRVTAASAIRELLASPELEAAHRAGYERGLRVGWSAGAYEARAEVKAKGGWLRRLFGRGSC